MSLAEVLPTDPVIREAAYGLAAHQLAGLRRWRTVSTVSRVVVIAAYSYLAPAPRGPR